MSENFTLEITRGPISLGECWHWIAYNDDIEIQSIEFFGNEDAARNNAVTFLCKYSIPWRMKGTKDESVRNG